MAKKFRKLWFFLCSKIRLKERTHLATTWFFSRIYSKQIIHFIGDSHVSAYGRGRYFIAHHIGPATAYKLESLSSTTNSNQKLFKELGKINKKRDIAVLVFGEIDCRMHIYKQFVRHGGTTSIPELVEITILKYGIVLKKIETAGYSFFVSGVVPAATQGNIYDNPYYPDSTTRLTINREFNKQLRSFCTQKGYRYLDIQSEFADFSGFISRNFSTDGLHLNQNAIPKLEKLLGLC